METGESVVRDILQEILVQGSEQAIQAVDSQTAIRYMNRFMTEISARGITLGYTSVTSLSDPITIPDGAINGLIYNTAIRLQSSYDITPNGQLGANARDGMNAMRHLAVTVTATAMPCTMPIGSGNEQDNTFSNQHFYDCPEDEILTEQNGNILLEDSTSE
jgi:hypothetical protein